MPVKAVSDPQELHDLTAFFTWAAWSSVAERPGTTHSYTNNFPYDPLAGNHPTGAALLWSAISFIACSAARRSCCWRSASSTIWAGMAAPSGREGWSLSASQTATLKFMAVAVLLFLTQTLVGAGVAHYRAEPGIVLRHRSVVDLPEQSVACLAFADGDLLDRDVLCRRRAVRGRASGRRQSARAGARHPSVFGAIVLVAVGSMLGEWASLMGLLPKTWFWLGDQGWEYLEIGRFWQFLLAIGLLFWFFLVWRAVAPARRDPAKRGFANFFLIAAFAIPLFYCRRCSSVRRPTTRSSMRGGSGSSICGWRASSNSSSRSSSPIIFYEMGLVQRITALRTIYLDAILYFGGGLIGTGHHWYWTGQTELNMACPACSLRWKSYRSR